MELVKISVVIPTYNPGEDIKFLIEKLYNCGYEIIIIDSSSTDNSLEKIKKYYSDVRIIQISKKDFNHGGTRNIGLYESKGEIIVYLTQDALPIDSDSLQCLTRKLIENKEIGMAYGRQIPYPNTGFFGTFARYFNYPPKSKIKSLNDKNTLGIKAIFASNSFAAYKKNVLLQVGGFPSNVILGEDTYVAAKILKLGYKIAYVAEAQVYHSHDYTVWQEFKRYFDTGVFHQREKWLLEEFAKAEGEGLRYVKSEILYAIKNHKAYLLPNIIFRNGIKFLGYRLGRMEKYIPYYVKKRLSMHKEYWDKNY